ncbi:MAG TPA: hypothetical protein DCG12_21545 [Planctomycetaceae bacterium]|nr:hypothetical protein [Planctomycetaceae bacterium]
MPTEPVEAVFFYFGESLLLEERSARGTNGFPRNPDAISVRSGRGARDALQFPDAGNPDECRQWMLY